MRFCRVFGIGVAAWVASSLLFGCSEGDSKRSAQNKPVISETQGEADAEDVCGAGGATDEFGNPDAACAIRTEYNVPDLALGDEPLVARDEEEEGIPANDPGVGDDLPQPGGNRGFGQNFGKGLTPMDRAGNDVNSCNGRTGPGYTTCGPNGNENCCASRTIPAGRAGTVTVNTAFDMGVYEVTSARFQAYVAAMNGNLRATPGIPANVAAALPTDRNGVDIALGPACRFRGDPAAFGALTWPSAQTEATVARLISDNNDRAADIRADATAPRLSAKPINCVSHQMAVAFCAWDGGRLPTNNEWVYVALGAGQGPVRTYPWGSGRTKDRLVTDLTGTNSDQFTYPEDFPFFGNGMNAYHIAPPGRKPNGASAYGIMDMGGNLLEWMADASGNAGIVRGGSWEGHRDDNAFAYVNYPLDRTYGSVGFRCAYGASQAAPAPPVNPPPAGEAQRLPIHRSYNGQIQDHLQTLTQGEGAPAWQYEGVSFLTLSAQVAGTVPLYRCRINNTSQHFISNAANCEGQTVEGGLGFVYAGEAAGTVGIYRCASPNGRDHLTTITPQECTNAGYRVEGRQGFAFPPGGQQVAPPPQAPPAPANCGVLGINGVLNVNQSVTSCDGRFVLVMQGDGNLVLYQRIGQGIQALWHTRTNGTNANRAIMQGDGNFVVYDAQNRARWNSRTYNNPGATLAVQNDGNVVVYSAQGRALWHTGTFGR